MRPEESPTSRPPVTFVVYAYNEEKFITAAIEGAFAQDYSPLEIILSDDGSSDNTFVIMREMTSNYQGPHKIILNQNVHNIGIGSQLTASVEKSTGDLILLANGDDISLPERTSATVEAWLKSNKEVHAIYTDLEEINEDGAVRGVPFRRASPFDTLEDGIRKRFGGIPAASLALTRSVFTLFGPLPDNLILEDNPLCLRAMLLGGVLRVPRPLVKYRVHSGNLSQTYAAARYDEWINRYRATNIWQKKEGVKAHLQMLRDLYQLPAESRLADEVKRARWAGMEKLLENSILHDYYTGDHSIGWIRRSRTLARLGILVLKLWLKTIFPSIEKRNDRWHYNSNLRAYSGRKK